MASTKFINATQAYKEYSIPRSALRELADKGTIERHEKHLFGGKVMNLFSVKDIERYINSSAK